MMRTRFDGSPQTTTVPRMRDPYQGQRVLYGTRFVSHADLAVVEVDGYL